jgi:integrase/recombinase XerD
MTRLRKMMLEELQRRHYSAATIRCYIRTVEEFSRRFNCSPDRLGPRHMREYQADLFRNGKSPGTVTQRLAALRFFYVKTLKKPWSIADTPYPKRPFHLPTILSRDRLMMVLYATGLRRAELTHLKVTDIDSQRMVIHVRGGKGRKDRDVMLSPKLLDFASWVPAAPPRPLCRGRRHPPRRSVRLSRRAPRSAMMRRWQVTTLLFD